MFSIYYYAIMGDIAYHSLPFYTLDNTSNYFL